MNVYQQECKNCGYPEDCHEPKDKTSPAWIVWRSTRSLLGCVCKKFQPNLSPDLFKALHELSIAIKDLNDKATVLEQYLKRRHS